MCVISNNLLIEFLLSLNAETLDCRLVVGWTFYIYRVLELLVPGAESYGTTYCKCVCFNKVRLNKRVILALHSPLITLKS